MFVMVWFYYISNIWKNQVFLKNRSPDFLLSPFFAQCECTVHSDAGNRRGKGKESGRAGKPPQSLRLAQCQLPQGGAFHAVPSGEWGPRLQGKTRLRKCCSKPCFAPVRFSRAGAQDILSFFHSSFFLSLLVCKCCASVVHLLCICCARRRQKTALRPVFPRLPGCAGFVQFWTLTVHCALRTVH